MNFGLYPSEIKELRQVFSKYAAVEKVYVFGSRATGTFREASDLDLALLGPLDQHTMTNLWFDLEEMCLLLKIDMIEYHKLPNSEFKTQIDTYKLPLYQRDGVSQ